MTNPDRALPPIEELARLARLRIEPAEAERLGLGDTTGVWVQLLAGNSPAAAAGVQIDDVIRAVNGRETPSVGAFREAVDPLREGERVKLDILRRGRSLEVDFDLPARPRESLSGLAI
ncbi:MAG: PDZ domain-containing protein, partial [Planctomycetota bacterium]